MKSSVSSYSALPPADWRSDAAKLENGLNCSQNTYTGLDPEKDPAPPLIDFKSLQEIIVDDNHLRDTPSIHCGSWDVHLWPDGVLMLK